MLLLNAPDCSSFLAEELSKRIRANPRYSLRSFAKSLGLSPGELSEVIRYKRALSVRSAMKISKNLGLNPEETKHLLYLAQKNSLDPNTDDSTQQRASLSPSASHQLSLDLFQIVSDWYAFAILNLWDTLNFKLDIQWIAKRLDISPLEVRITLERLERVGLLERKSGQLAPSKEFVFTSSGVPSEAIRNYHRQILQKALQALETQAPQEREITGCGFAMNPADLPDVKKEIHTFMDQLSEKYSKRKLKEVYHLEIAFQKLTHDSGDSK